MTTLKIDFSKATGGFDWSSPFTEWRTKWLKDERRVILKFKREGRATDKDLVDLKEINKQLGIRKLTGE